MSQPIKLIPVDKYLDAEISMKIRSSKNAVKLQTGASALISAQAYPRALEFAVTLGSPREDGPAHLLVFNSHCPKTVFKNLRISVPIPQNRITLNTEDMCATVASYVTQHGTLTLKESPKMRAYRFVLEIGDFKAMTNPITRKRLKPYFSLPS